MSVTETNAIPTIAKQSAISEHLRDRIVRGDLAPGGRLPTQVQLVEQFRVSGVTIQRALDRLSREGFINTRGRHGTFVSDSPPHLSRFGLVFVEKHERGHWRSRFYDMLEAQAMRLQRDSDRRITVFDDISGHEDSPATQQLLRQVREHRMAGLMLVGGEVYQGLPLLEEPGICRVLILSHKVDGLQSPAVYPDMPGMLDLALDTILAQGRKRIATLITAPVYQSHGAHLRKSMQARGIEVRNEWLQIVPHEIPDAVRNAVLLMMNRRDAADRPDALFIADDNLSEGASTGLVAAGISVPKEISIVAHCNFPWSSPSVLPMQRVGFDTRRIIEAALGVIDAQRQGRPITPLTRIPAVLEEAVTASA